MKLSDADKVKPLERRLRMLRNMEQNLELEVPHQATLVIDGEELKVDSERASYVVRLALYRVMQDLIEIGVEIDT